VIENKQKGVNMYPLGNNAHKSQREIEVDRVMRAMWRAAELAGTSDMTDEEINAEIVAAREERQEMRERELC
jgi:hypothetical protein